jgi:2-C-methyl-D-erythritol 4-phosphate cytidylyltransferase
VRIALELTSAEADLVLIHDAARPLARPELFSAVLAAASQFGAAIAAVPLADTLKRAHAGVVCATLARDGLFQSQTPQAFRRALLLSAFANAQERGWEATDEAALLERIGRQVHIAQGSAENFKITTAEDLAMAQRLVAARRRTIG